jgi:hypothetical protein
VYIGIGTVVLIIIVVLVILMLRRLSGLCTHSPHHAAAAGYLGSAFAEK